MNKKLFIFYLIFWLAGRFYLLAPEYLYSRIYHSIALHFDLLCLISFIVHLIPYTKIKEKMFFVYFLCYELLSLCFFTYVQFNCEHLVRALHWSENKMSGVDTISPALSLIEHIFIPVFVIYVAYEIYRRLSKFDKEKSACLNDTNIFLVFCYPKDIIGLVLCVFSPYKANSICLFAGEYFYKYRRIEGCIIKQHISEVSLDDYFFTDTGILYKYRKDDLEHLVGKPWEINNTCLNTFQRIVGPLHNYL